MRTARLDSSGRELLVPMPPTRRPNRGQFDCSEPVHAAQGRAALRTSSAVAALCLLAVGPRFDRNCHHASTNGCRKR